MKFFFTLFDSLCYNEDSETPTAFYFRQKRWRLVFNLGMPTAFIFSRKGSSKKWRSVFKEFKMTQLLNKLAKTAHTWNGAISYSTTGFEIGGACLDYFSKAGTYTNRDQKAVNADMVKIFSDNENLALSIVFGLRLITRKPLVDGIEETQTGYGRRDEFYKAVNWLIDNKPNLLYSNLHLIPVFGCWKDFLQESLIERLDRKQVYELVAANLGDNLLRKYLPQIRSGKHKKVEGEEKKEGNLRTERDKKRVMWAKGLCKFLKINYREYRKLKTEGAAHVWQKQMTNKDWDNINFNGIPGKAMLNHTVQKGKDKQTVFERHNQIERLKEWVLGQKTIKFTGYPYELTRAAAHNKKPSVIQKLILDRQFETVLEPMKVHKLGNVLPCLDISGSMTMDVGNGVSAYDICISMGIVFSCLNNGHFKDVVCGFSDSPILTKLAGSMCDRLNIIETDKEFQRVAWGSTNFQGVIDLLVKTRKENPNIPVEEYPETLLVISDMQMNVAGKNSKTNYEMAMKKLNSVGLGDVRIIWWFVNGQGSDFPAQMDSKGCYLIGGFDPVNIKSLMGLSSGNVEKKDFKAEEKKEETPFDGMMNFLKQPIFNLLKF